MGTNLARQLERYYSKAGNRIVFRNGMTLTKLAWGMEIDPGLLSKVVNSRDNRLFSQPQLAAFCRVLRLTSQERWDLEYALYKDLVLRRGLDPGLPVFPTTLEIAVANSEAVYRVSLQGDSQLAQEIVEALDHHLREIVRGTTPLESHRSLQAMLGSALVPTAVLFAASRHERTSTNEIYRYDIPGPAGTPVLGLTIKEPSFNSVCGLAFSPAGELFVTNVSPSYRDGSISRLLDPTGTPSFNGTITSDKFTSPVGVVLNHDQLFVAQRMSSDVLRFTVDPTGTTTFSGAITDGLCCTAPRNVIAGPRGDELFVTECYSVDEVNRYLLDASGNAIPNGVITGGGLSNPHNMAFSPWGELFVANAGSNSVSRFVFDAAGNAVPNGQITGPTLNVPVGLDFSPWGELFVGNHYGAGGISRWLFDSLHKTIPNGVFMTPHTLADIKFSPILLPRHSGLTVNITVSLARAPDGPQSGTTHAVDYFSDLIQKQLAS